MYKIESLQNEKVKAWRKLKEKKYRDETDLFLIEGDHMITEALKYRMVTEILTTEEQNYEVPTIQVTEEIMKSLTEQQTPPKVMGICKKLEPKEMIGDVLLLDGIQDPGNLGTILRSAVAFSMKNIVLSPTCVDLYNSKVIRSTEGIFFSLNIIRTELVPCLQSLKQKGYRILGADMSGKNLTELNLADYKALVIGSEGLGISPQVRTQIDTYARIEMSSACESLNAAVSASILLYERQTRR